MATSKTTVLPRQPLLLRTSDAARLLGFTERALQLWRQSGLGPDFVKIGQRAVRYRVKDLEAWAEAHRRSSTAQAERT